MAKERASVTEKRGSQVSCNLLSWTTESTKTKKRYQGPKTPEFNPHVMIQQRYDGKNNESQIVLRLMKNNDVILVCPEELGGLPTPRIPSEIRIIDGEIKVVSKKGKDVTNEFNEGAKKALKLSHT